MEKILACFHEKGYRKLYELGIVQIGYSLIFLYTFGLIWGSIYGLTGYFVFLAVMSYYGYQTVSGIDSMSALEIYPENLRN